MYTNIRGSLVNKYTVNQPALSDIISRLTVARVKYFTHSLEGPGNSFLPWQTCIHFTTFILTGNNGCVSDNSQEELHVQMRENGRGIEREGTKTVDRILIDELLGNFLYIHKPFEHDQQNFRVGRIEVIAWEHFRRLIIFCIVEQKCNETSACFSDKAVQKMYNCNLNTFSQ